MRTGFVTVADSGCGLVAAYNILVSRGINVSFRDIYAYALKNHMLKSSGLAVYQTLRIIFDFDPTVTDADDEFNAQSSLIIYSYAEAYGGGAHIVAAINRGSGNYDFYNDSFYPRNIIGYPISYRDYYTSVKRSGYLAPDDPEKPNMFCILIY